MSHHAHTPTTPRAQTRGARVTGTILDEIIGRTVEDLDALKRERPPRHLEQEIGKRGDCRDVAAALRRPPGSPGRVIAELKKASPSKGLIRPDFTPEQLCRDLQRGGAAALSVLTEPHYFQGSPDILRAVTDRVDIPVLRKDFIVDEYQVLQARAWGADAVLLIAAALGEERFRCLHALATDLGLAVLAEVHTVPELDSVLEAGARVVGVNSRDLHTFRVDLQRMADMLSRIPADRVVVAESGIKGPSDMRRLAAAGADAFLIGEMLMRETRPGDALAQWLQEAEP